MYSEQHALAYRSQEKGKILYNLSFFELLWWLAGGFLVMKLTQFIPPIPNMGYYGYALHLTPLLFSLVFAHVKHPSTGWPLHKYLLNYLLCRFRKRTFT